MGPGRVAERDTIRSGPTAVRMRAQQGQEVHVAVADGLDVDVDAVEALVDQAAALRHDALALSHVREVQGPLDGALVADAQPADPRQHLHLRGHAARHGEEAPHLLAAVDGERPAASKGMRWG